MNHDNTSKGWIFWACLGILLLLIPIPVNSIPDGHDQDYYNFDGSKQADYYFNEGAGTSTHDDSGNGNTMTLTGTGWTTGKDGTSAISFSQESYTTLPNNANLNLEELDEWNICMNIKFLGLMSYQQTDLFQKCDGNGNGISAKIISDIIILYINPNTQNSFTLTDPEPADIYDESWHYLAFSYRCGYYSIILDPTIVYEGCRIEEGSKVKVEDNTGQMQIGNLNNAILDDFHWGSVSTECLWERNSVGYWTCDENLNGEDRILDDLISWNHEDISSYCGATFTTSCMEGVSCLEFSGELSYVVIPHHDELSLCTQGNTGNDLYIELWFKRSSSSEQPVALLEKASWEINGYRLYFEGNTLSFSIYNNYVENNLQSYSLSTNTWYHIWARLYQNKMYLEIKDSSDSMVFQDEKEVDNGIGYSNMDLWLGLSFIAHKYYGYMDGIIIGKNKDLEMTKNKYDKYFNFNMDERLFYTDNNLGDIYLDRCGSPYPQLVGTTPYGRAMRFDSNNYYKLRISNPYSFVDNNINIELMVNPNEMDLEEELILQYQAWSLSAVDTEDERYISFEFAYQSYYNSQSYTNVISISNIRKENEWSTIGISLKLSDVQTPCMEFYMNGHKVGEEEILGDPSYYYSLGGNQYLYIGGNGSFGLEGLMDELTIWSYYDNEEKYHPMNIHTPSLKLDFDEGAEYYCYDNTGQNNNAYLGQCLRGRDIPKEGEHNDYQIYSYSSFSGMEIITIIGGTNQGVTKDIVETGQLQSGEYYCSVGSENAFPEDCDDSTIYYTQKNNPSWSTGINGNCLYFDNVEDENPEYMMIYDANQLDPLNEMTLMFWIKPSSSDRCIISKMTDYPDPEDQTTGQYQVKITESNEIEFMLNKDIGNQNYGIIKSMKTSSIGLNNWHHVKFILKDQVGYIFIDGTLNAKKDLGIVQLYDHEYSGDDIYIGDNTDYSLGYNGYIDDIIIYNYAYLENEIIKQYFTFDSDNIEADTSPFPTNCQKGSSEEGPTSNNNGKYGKCIYFDGNDDYLVGDAQIERGHSFEAWIKPSSMSGDYFIISACSISAGSYPVILGYDGYQHQFFIQTEPNVINRLGFGSRYGEWHHIAYSVGGESKPNIKKDTINIFYDGTWSTQYLYEDSDAREFLFKRNTDDSQYTYYIGNCPDNIWGITYQCSSYIGYMDEIIITNGYKNFREDRDNDGISDCYELIRSRNSDEYKSTIHNSRIAILMAPIYQTDEIQFTYDITMMRHYLISNGWMDHDILFMSFYYSDTPSYLRGEWYYDTTQQKYLQDENYKAYWNDGCPYKGCLKNILDALEYGGPACIYHQETNYIDEQEFNRKEDVFYTVPLLDENDILLIDLRDHGTGYKDDPRNNGDTDSDNNEDTNEEWDFGWRNGRCRTISENDVNHYDEHADEADYSEQEFAIDLYHYIPPLPYQIPGGAQGTPPNYTYTPADYPTYGLLPWTLDITSDDINEELYLIYHDTATREEWWWRLYIDGYSSDDEWDGQVLAAYKDHGQSTTIFCYDYKNTQPGGSGILHLTGIDLNQNDLSNNQDEYSIAYITDLHDFIDIDEGFATLEFTGSSFKEYGYHDIYQDNYDDLPDIGGGPTNNIPQIWIWWDTDLKEECENLTYKHLIFLLDCCYSGGFVYDMHTISSGIMSSNREGSPSERYNVMFYSRINHDNKAKYLTTDILHTEDRGTYITSPTIADGVSGLDSNRDIVIDNDLIDNIISFNEGAIFTDSCLAQKDSSKCTYNLKWTGTNYWKSDPGTYFEDEDNQLFL